MGRLRAAIRARGCLSGSLGVLEDAPTCWLPLVVAGNQFWPGEETDEAVYWVEPGPSVGQFQMPAYAVCLVSAHTVPRV